MKIYNQDKTVQLNEKELDFSKGYLKKDILITDIPEIKGIEEKSHYEIVAIYPNGGKDVKKIIDVPGVEPQSAIHEEEEINVYIPYTATQLQIFKLKDERDEYQKLLKDTDYQAIKYAEGYYTDEEYKEKKEIRQIYRDKINELNRIIDSLETTKEV